VPYTSIHRDEGTMKWVVSIHDMQIYVYTKLVQLSSYI